MIDIIMIGLIEGDRIVTYNIAGLPKLISAARKMQIGEPMPQDYDDLREAVNMVEDENITVDEL
mgnify:CR=1 FL=1